MALLTHMLVWSKVSIMPCRPGLFILYHARRSYSTWPMPHVCADSGTQLLQVDPSLQNLVQKLRKPLRPLWVSQLTRVWINEVPALQELPFVPLYLVSASLPNVRQRRQLGGPFSQLVLSLPFVLLACHDFFSPNGTGSTGSQVAVHTLLAWCLLIIICFSPPDVLPSSLQVHLKGHCVPLQSLLAGQCVTNTCRALEMTKRAGLPASLLPCSGCTNR